MKLLCFLSLCAVLAHAGPARDSVTLYAYSDGFHTFIVFPDTCSGCPDSLLEYEYAEKAWYLDGETQWYRVFPVLFTNTEGTVGECRKNLLDFQKLPDSSFTFMVSFQQYRAIREYIETWIDRKTLLWQNGNETYYRSTKPYNVLNSCHSFVLKVLEAGGIDVNPRWGLLNGLTVWRLKAAEKERKGR